MNSLTTEAILQAIPHRPPMLLVDEVLEISDRRIRTRKQFTGDEYFFQGHYPHLPILPGVILCEAGSQAGAVLLSGLIPKHAQEGVPVATRLNQVKFKSIVRPGDTIDVEVELVENVGDAYFMTAKIRRGSQLAARFEFACTVTKVAPDGLLATA